MIDINELRRKLRSDDLIDHVDIHANVKPVLTELINRLEAAESDALEQARLNGMGASREAALMAKLEAAEKTKSDWLRANAPRGWIDDLRVERDALRAHIEKMEKQPPICRVKDLRRARYMTKVVGLDPDAWLYALPGAQTQGEEK